MANDSISADNALAAGTGADDAPAAGEPRGEFFISRAGADKDVAIAIAGILREAGFTTWLQDGDLDPASFMARMAEGWASCNGLICLLSKAYQQSEHCRKEHEFALHDDPRNLKRRVIVLRIEDCTPVEHLADLAYVDLLPVLNDAGALAQVVRGAVLPDRFRTEADLAAIHRRLPQKVLHDRVQAVPGFTDRAEQLAAVEKALWAEGGGTAAVHGLGGVGRSSLVKEYAWRNRERYQGIWWVHASATLAEDLIDLGARFISGLKDVKERDNAVRLALNWLESGKHDKPWLLIYDDVEEPGHLEGLTPRSGAHVLMTSRWSDWGEAAAGVPLGVFTPEAATAYLLEATNGNDRAGAAALAETLGYLPLALDHAAVYCRRTGMELAAYRQLAGDLLEKAPGGVDHDAPVLATFSLAIARAGETCPASQKLLGLAAYLAPDRIPLALFTTDVLTEVERVEAVAALTEVSLIAFTPLDDGSQCIAVHPLVQAAMRGILKDMGEHDNAATLALELVADAYPDDSEDVRTWPECDRLNPHALAVLEHAQDGGDRVRNSLRLLHRAALNYASRAAYAQAEPLYRRALAVDEASYGPDHPDVACGLDRLAELLRATNRPGEAEPLMRRALAIFEEFERSTGHRHPQYEAVAADLAELEAQLREGVRPSAPDSSRTPMTGADPVPDQASAGTGAPLPEADAAMVPDPEGLTPSELDTLDTRIKAAGQSAEAEPLLRRAVALTEADLGADHPRLAGYLDDLALLLISAERPAEAEPLMRRALAIEEAHLGPDDPNIARLLNNLAQVLKDTGRPAEAAPLMRRVMASLDRFARDTGERHPSHEIAADNLAALEAQMAAAAPVPVAATAADARPAPGTATVATPASAGAQASARPGSKATFLNWMFGRL